MATTQTDRPLTWRKIEAALVEWFSANHFRIDDDGDKQAWWGDDEDDDEDGPSFDVTCINLTSLARFLEEELRR